MVCNLSPFEVRRKELERVTRVEGTKIWRQQLEQSRRNKVQEQREVRELLENYWPWGRPGGGAPNNSRQVGIKNVNLDEIFADEDFKKSKRKVGVFQFGHPGGGTFNSNKNNQKQIRFHEDPALRFQWGEDLRRTVDNTLRYRSKRTEQEEYKKQLDAMVEEKIKSKEKEKRRKLEFERSMGWTSDSTIRRIQNQLSPPEVKLQIHHNPSSPNQIHQHDSELPRDFDHGFYQDKSQMHKNHRRHHLTTSEEHSSSSHGIELVPLIVRKRQDVLKMPLTSTDVTRGDPKPKRPLIPERKYLSDLNKQVNQKYLQQKHDHVEEVQNCKQHHETWENFWGRPGHGAPKAGTQKGRLMAMLYPQMRPMPVH